MAIKLAILDDDAKVKDALYVWAEWMKQDDSEDLGYDKKSSVFASGGMRLWEELEASADHVTALAVNAIMEGMPIQQQNAIHHFHLAAVWKPRRSRIEDDYADALISVTVGLRRRGLI